MKRLKNKNSIKVKYFRMNFFYNINSKVLTNVYNTVFSLYNPLNINLNNRISK